MFPQEEPNLNKKMTGSEQNSTKTLKVMRGVKMLIIRENGK